MDKKQLQQRVTEQRRRVRRRLTIRGVLSLLVVLTFIRCASSRTARTSTMV